MKALINPNEETKYISSWNNQEPIYTVLGKRICEVGENEFEVANPLFWIDCDINVTADNYYYDVTTQSILIKPDDVEASKIDPKTVNQPITTGTQTI